MPLATLNDVSIQFRGPALLDGVDWILQAGDRVGLLGRNGAGKTTLLKLLAGEMSPDHGSVDVQGRVAWLPQDVPEDLRGDVAGVVRQGMRTQAASTDQETRPSWEVEHRIDKILSQMDLAGELPVDSLSSGMKRRVLLARALVDQPDLLLLDEPTNHLDIESILWLEEFLARWKTSLVFVTHDRQFLRKLATRIVEIDRGRLFDWSCDYDTFLKRKAEALAAEEKQHALFDKKLAEEEAWIRQGIKARRTRNEGRVRALKALRLARQARRTQQGTSQINIQDGVRSGNLIVHAEDVTFAHGEAAPILSDFGTTIMRGDKVGIVGPNGVGKTTLLQVLLGKLQPQSGRVRLGANVQIAYFDQLRSQLDGEKTVEEDVSDGYQTLNIGGRQKHILGYLQDFLFTPQRARTPIKRLSGGEKNRVLLAKLFARPANLVILDEPTNDLDMETLDVLESRLVDFQGTLIVVSHDRDFLNNVVTSVIAFDKQPTGGYQVREYVGGYDDWIRQRPEAAPTSASSKQLASAGPERQPSSAEKPPKQPDSSDKPKRKLTFKETQELNRLPEQIEQTELAIAQLHERLADPDLYKKSGDEIGGLQQQLTELEEQLSSDYERWEQLEALA